MSPTTQRWMLKLAPWIFFIALMVIWQAACEIWQIKTFILPAPDVIAKAFMHVDFSRWMMHLWATLHVALIGFVISIVVAIPLAVLLTQSELLSRSVYPLLVVIQATPVVAIAPLIIVLMGSEDPSRILITCLITFFPIVVSTATGIQETPAELIELSKSLRAPFYREILQIRLPYAIPHIFSGLKVSVTLSIVGAVVAEFVAAEKGLGYFIQFSTSYFKIPQAFASLMFLAIISLIMFKAVGWFQRLVFPWSLPKDSRK